MAAANAKFEQRFNAMERALHAQNSDLTSASAEEMEEAWQLAKAAESK
jgi:uncharacterized protein YabN with tetrapyrrole methylase and pyrophosphatase domain